jgi:hypothetical protein
VSKPTSRSKQPALREFLLKLNSDAVFRAEFLESPVEHLTKQGIVLDASGKKEVRKVARELNEKLPELGTAPSGFVMIIEQEGGPQPGATPKEVEIYII